MPDMRLSVIDGISADAGARHDFRPHHAAPIAVYLEGRDRTPSFAYFPFENLVTNISIIKTSEFFFYPFRARGEGA